MNFLIFFGVLVFALLLVLFASLRSPSADAQPHTIDEVSFGHVTRLPQIRQALSSADLDFLSSSASPATRQRAFADRRRIILAYLSEVSRDFEKLLRLARVIAALSPEVSASTEWERIRLTMQFRLSMTWIRLRLAAGSFPLEQITALNNMVSGVSVRLETAMVQLGERAALAAEIASSLQGSRVDPS